MSFKGGRNLNHTLFETRNEAKVSHVVYLTGRGRSIAQEPTTVTGAIFVWANIRAAAARLSSSKWTRTRMHGTLQLNPLGFH